MVPTANLRSKSVPSDSSRGTEGSRLISYGYYALVCEHFPFSKPHRSVSVGHRAPPARSGHRCVADNTNLYVFGGYNPDFDESGGSENEDYPLFRELWRYHFATGTWQQIRTEGYMPTELASMSGNSPAGTLSYAPRGRGYSPFRVFSQLFCTATTCSCSAAPESRSGKTTGTTSTCATSNTRGGRCSTAEGRNPTEYMDR